jgi:hypothetical protein
MIIVPISGKFVREVVPEIYTSRKVENPKKPIPESLSCEPYA